MANYSIAGKPPDLRTFMQNLEARLNSLSHEQLKSLLITHARGLAPKERNEFLLLFSSDLIECKQSTSEASFPDDELVNDIDAFIDTLESGEYYEGYEWDDSIHDERAYGDESWIGEMDALFDRASEMFFSSHRDLALTAYNKLLHAFEFDQEAGYFCGEDSADLMVDTDIAEAKARYFRCIYDLSPAEARVNDLLEEMELLSNISENVGLSEIINADTNPLADQELFLRDLIVALKELDSEGSSRHNDSWRRPLLREAVLLQDGVDGLAQLARECGATHPEIYLELVRLHWHSGDLRSAEIAAKEGVENVVSSGDNARLADALATLNAHTGDLDAAVAARKHAWRVSPTLQRLLSYCSEGSPDRQILDMRLADESFGVSDGSYSIRASYNSEEIPGLQLLLHLLAHDYDSVVLNSKRMKPVGWSHSGHAGPVVFPFLVVAASGQTDHFVDRSAISYLLDDMTYKCGYEETDYLIPPYVREKPLAEGLTQLFLDTLACHPVSSEDRMRYLEIAIGIAKQRIDYVVTNTYRGAYERAARLAVAIGEAMSIQGETADGTDFAMSFRKAYPRHSAFRSELAGLIQQSPYLL